MNRTTLITILLVVPMVLRPRVTPAHLLLPLVEVEQQAMNTTFQYALEYNKTNEAANWMNPDTARSGIVIPVRTFANREGRPCRKFTTSITLDGRQQHGYGTACRQVNGTWYIVTNGPPAKMSVLTGRPLHVYPLLNAIMFHLISTTIPILSFSASIISFMIASCILTAITPVA